MLNDPQQPLQSLYVIFPNDVRFNRELDLNLLQTVNSKQMLLQVIWNVFDLSALNLPLQMEGNVYLMNWKSIEYLLLDYLKPEIIQEQLNRWVVL